MTSKNSRPNGGLRSVADIALQRDAALDRCHGLLADASSTLATIDQSIGEEEIGIRGCHDDLEKMQRQMVLLDDQILDENSITGGPTADANASAEECPQCHTNAYCISRPIKVQDLSRGQGFSATIVASLKMFRLKWGSHASARVTSCMKCGQQFIHGQ